MNRLFAEFNGKELKPVAADAEIKPGVAIYEIVDGVLNMAKLYCDTWELYMRDEQGRLFTCLFAGKLSDCYEELKKYSNAQLYAVVPKVFKIMKPLKVGPITEEGQKVLDSTYTRTFPNTDEISKRAQLWAEANPGKQQITNPCGEIPLKPQEFCNIEVPPKKSPLDLAIEMIVDRRKQMKDTEDDLVKFLDWAMTLFPESPAQLEVKFRTAFLEAVTAVAKLEHLIRQRMKQNGHRTPRQPGSV